MDKSDDVFEAASECKRGLGTIAENEEENTSGSRMYLLPTQTTKQNQTKAEEEPPRIFQFKPIAVKERTITPMTETELALYESEAEINWKWWSMLGGVWVVTLLLIFVRGGKGSDSLFGVPFCGGAYWAVSTLAIFVLAAVSMASLRSLMVETSLKKYCNYDFAEGDVIWDTSKGLKLSVVTFFAGIVAGLIGIGGGMVVGPLLLDLGFIPQVSSALTATNVLLSASTVSQKESTSQFCSNTARPKRDFLVLVLVGGVAPIDEAALFAGCCLIGAWVGKNLLSKLIKKLGKQSIIIFLLGGVIACAILAVLIRGTTDFATNGVDVTFTDVCA